VEAAVDAIVLDEISDDEAIERAKHAFETEAQGEISPEIDKQRRAIPKMVRQAAAVFRRLGEPVARQHRVEVWVDGIEVPIIGYADYVYPEFVVDLNAKIGANRHLISVESGR
jgi:hypothetical protein